MAGRPLAALALILILGGLMEHDARAQAATPGGGDEKPRASTRAVDASDVARLPAPGTVVPGAFAFTPDGKALTYLKSESTSLSRVLWRLEVAGGPPRVVARAPGGGDTDANVSREEALRRERQRLRDTGITQLD